MGQISTKIYQKACIWDFSVQGAGVAYGMGMSIIGGESIISIRYTVLVPLATAGGIATNIDAGWAFVGGIGMVNVLDTIAVLNAGVGYWFTHIPAAPGYPKLPIGGVSPNEINFISVGGADPMSAGKMLFSFTLMSHAL